MAIVDEEIGFEAFVARFSPRLRRALVAAYGSERGADATAEALAYAWEHWPRVSGMEHPVPYLYRVGQSRTRGRKQRVVFAVPDGDKPWVEPALPAALSALSATSADRAGGAMSLTDTHREQIRALADAVDDPSIADIMFATSVRPSPRRSRRVLLATTAAVVAVLVVVGLVIAVRDDRSTRPTRVQPAQTVTLPESCVVTQQGSPGCDMTPRDASAYLNFDARVPDGLPEGWVVERAKLRVYRDPLPEGEPPLPAGVESVPIYNQIWTPPGTDLTVTGTCPPYLQVRERPALPGEQFEGVQAVELGNGTVVYGEVAQPSSCAGMPTIFTSAIWVNDGISFLVSAQGVERDDVIRIIESLGDS